MTRQTVLLILFLVFTFHLNALYAESPVYGDRMLVVPEVIILDNNSVAGDVTFHLDDDGKWALAGGKILSLASIDSVTVSLPSSRQEEKTVTVTIKGSLPNGCASLDKIVQARRGSVFHVALVSRVREGVMCTQQLVPFTRQVLLSAEGLPVGAYTLKVNSKTVEFELDESVTGLVCCKKYCCTCAPEYHGASYIIVPEDQCRRPENIIGGNCYEKVDNTLCLENR
jgi:hypothetical protein